MRIFTPDDAMTTPDKRENEVFEEKRRLSELPFFERDPACPGSGVLLSDLIEHYCSPKFSLIAPFHRDYLRPAGYDLRVGNNYTKDGLCCGLSTGESLTIDPYQVAIIQTLETLNLPDFLIGRWNIRVGLAYKGLLWVGGAQVDPGFRGRLSCPIYNLSTEPVNLRHGEVVAMIDFVTTTAFKPAVTALSGSKAFQWWHDKKLVFQEYHTKLKSGVADRLHIIDESEKESRRLLENAKKDTDQKFRSIESRIDTFMTLAFTVLAVLFAGLGIVATRDAQPTFWNPTLWVAAIAFFVCPASTISPH